MHSPYQNIYWFHEDQEFLHGQYMNSTEFNYKHASKKTGEKKKKEKAVTVTKPQHILCIPLFVAAGCYVGSFTLIIWMQLVLAHMVS